MVLLMSLYRWERGHLARCRSGFQRVRFKVMWCNTKTKSPLTLLFQKGGGDKYSALPK